MEKQERTNMSVDPLLADLSLAKESGASHGPSSSRAQLEESQLLDRMRMLATEINRKAGYHVLEVLDFLPPQRSVFRVCLSKNRVDYIMEIILRTKGPAVVFHSAYRFSERLGRYFHRYLRSFTRTAFKLYINPREVSDEVIHNWFSFLLSGFDKKLKPRLYSESSGKSNSGRVGSLEYSGK